MIEYQTQFAIETPEDLALSYTLAGPGSRFMAFVIDQLYIFLISMGLFLISSIIWIPLSLSDGDGAGLLAGSVVVLALGFLQLLYFGYLEWKWKGQTLGKRSVGIRVVQEHGYALSTRAILIRTLFRVIDHIPLLWLLPLMDKQHRRLGDLTSGTLVVVVRPEAVQVVSDTERPPNIELDLTMDDWRVITPADLQAIERVLEPREGLPVATQIGLQTQLVEAIYKKMGRVRPRGIPTSQILQVIYFEARERL